MKKCRCCKSKNVTGKEAWNNNAHSKPGTLLCSGCFYAPGNLIADCPHNGTKEEFEARLLADIAKERSAK